MQPAARACSECGSHAVVEPNALTTEVIAGITAISKPPATGWRDTVALLATTLGFFAGMGVGFFVAGSWGAVLFGGAAVVGGYNKQFWKPAFKHTKQLRVIAAPAPPVAEAFIGRVHTHASQLAGGALAIATTYTVDGGTLARTIESVPFWLISGGRRILIDGAIRISPASGQRVPSAFADLVKLGVEIHRRARKRIVATRVTLQPDDMIVAKGELTTKQLFDGGYRDNLVDTLFGEAGQPIWIARDLPMR